MIEADLHGLWRFVPMGEDNAAPQGGYSFNFAGYGNGDDDGADQSQDSKPMQD